MLLIWTGPIFCRLVKGYDFEFSIEDKIYIIESIFTSKTFTTSSFLKDTNAMD